MSKQNYTTHVKSLYSQISFFYSLRLSLQSKHDFWFSHKHTHSKLTHPSHLGIQPNSHVIFLTLSLSNTYCLSNLLNVILLGSNVTCPARKFHPCLPLHIAVRLIKFVLAFAQVKFPLVARLVALTCLSELKERCFYKIDLSCKNTPKNVQVMTIVIYFFSMHCNNSLSKSTVKHNIALLCFFAASLYLLCSVRIHYWIVVQTGQYQSLYRLLSLAW